MPKHQESHDAPIKRGPGRPPKNLPPKSMISEKVDMKVTVEEPKKKIANCSAEKSRPSMTDDSLKKKGRPPKGIHKNQKKKRPRPNPLEKEQLAGDTESSSGDDIPSSFSEVVSIIVQKVQETQVSNCINCFEIAIVEIRPTKVLKLNKVNIIFSDSMLSFQTCLQ